MDIRMSVATDINNSEVEEMAPAVDTVKIETTSNGTEGSELASDPTTGRAREEQVQPKQEDVP